MRACVETELKLAASPAMLASLRTHPALAGAETIRSLLSTYFDTPDLDLRRAGLSIRVRTSADGVEQTLKTTGTAVQRGEWSATLAEGQDTPDLSIFPRKIRQRVMAVIGDRSLRPVVTTRVQRTTRLIRRGAALIEVAFDHGTLEAGPRQARACELELELREGRLGALCDLALELPLGPELSWSGQSKAARAFALAEDAGTMPSAVPLAAREPCIGQDASIGQGFRSIVWAGLDRLIELTPGIVDHRHGGAPEAIHQARVAIRRLRVAMSLFGKAIDDGELPVFRAELQAISHALGPVRDMDVLIARLDRVPDGPPAAGNHELRDALLRHRADTLGAAQAVMCESGFQRLLIGVARWIEDGSWRASADARPLKPFARKRLDRLARRTLKAVRHLDKLSDADLHRLRISAKKWRYGAAALASAFPGRTKAKAREQRQLSQLQDSLGELHDLAVAETAHTALFEREPPIEAAGLAARLAQATGTDVAERRVELLHQAEKALKALHRHAPWWRE